MNEVTETVPEYDRLASVRARDRRKTNGIDRMRYWLTTHWPPREDAPNDENRYVWICNGEQGAGANVARGGLVLVYESRSGKTKVCERPDGTTEKVRCLQGKGGIIYYGKVTANLAADPERQPDRYTDGTSTWWKWCAPLEILSRSGFVGCEDVATALGYTPNYSFRGFGQGDRADLVLSDAYGRVVGVEIEPAVGASDIVGPSKRSSIAICSNAWRAALAETVGRFSSLTRLIQT